MDGASAQRSEASVNKAVQASKNRFRPKRSASQPLAGRTIALATR
jgi:hypothetical protein